MGSANGRGLEHELLNAIRPIARRVRGMLPIALMADHHPAEFGIVGSVISSSEEVVPELIGSDCGCGVSAIRTELDAARFDGAELRSLFEKIHQSIPVGTAQNREVRRHVDDLEIWSGLKELEFVSNSAIQRLRHQFGTLGGGNHFIELAHDGERIWLLVHSGSRFLGGMLYDSYRGRNLALSSSQAEQFFAAQDFVMRFARLSRAEIAERVLNVLSEGAGEAVGCSLFFIDMPHNFIELRNASEAPLAIHRKGACRAALGEYLVIPGSMATGSYIVEGRGNPDSYCSSSHGAGRILSRRAACRQLSMKDFHRDMANIVWSESESLLDEAPRAYKNLDEVMRSQKDLVKIHHRLRPLLSVKGEG